MASLNGDVPTYKMMSEGCANYFDGGACRREDLTYAFSISNNIPKIGELLIPGYQEHPHYNSYVMGRLLCASFHQSASDIHFKQLLETHRNNKDARTLESYYQASFEDFVKNTLMAFILDKATQRQLALRLQVQPNLQRQANLRLHTHPPMVLILNCLMNLYMRLKQEILVIFLVR